MSLAAPPCFVQPGWSEPIPPSTSTSAQLRAAERELARLREFVLELASSSDPWAEQAREVLG